MQIDPVLEWRRLAEEYRGKSAEELLELARDFGDLTEAAQQVLRGEMQSRGMGDPEEPRPAAASRTSPQQPRQVPLSPKNAPSNAVNDAVFGAFGGRAPELVTDTRETRDRESGPHDYTWKTDLCACETAEQAQQLVEALRQAGIDGWVEHPGGDYAAYPRVLVAADQLDQARVVAARPIPREIVDESKEEIPEFLEPKCPRCGSDDVVLEGVDPENTWRCEQCDAEWTDSMPGIGDGAPEGAKGPS